MPGATRSTRGGGAAKRRRQRVAGGVVGVVLSLALAAVLVPWAAGAPAAGVQPAACPSSEPQEVAANAWSEAQAELAPAGPTALRLCRYLGSNQPSAGSLVRGRLVSQAALLTSLVDQLDALPRFPPGVYSCLADTGSQLVVRLAYPGGEQVTVFLNPGECGWAGNGDLASTTAGLGGAPGGQGLVAELRRLTPQEHGDARVSGRVWLCGGPAPSRCFAQDATVAALDRGGDVVAVEPTRTLRARFSFSLPPGTYTIEAWADHWTGWQGVVLHAGRTQHTEVIVPIR